ncbi:MULTISPECIES: 16S rRNA (adenine(1518)-N(6)/adenine(1519)-N(6))-dimethyltransferase RsmA [Pelosinus]|uniref:Ribosomal RNA small subunit methyltransferase A n=1 Tax=Pelosinus fermentans B4 TaxID=1149862 RepID=I9ASF8_9FIRM|nr:MULTISPECIES: 16S rRNA (adenine(1518)-N(6)/adenine(1519)-N(6))-dimethyltransferase RsmA [Pelosinus]EIW15872.1 dimethyladenosine transferase [Pelosinus fermentans B4]EIW27422.1 Ribosomal RNA small subunit methyltransferase A [Pelosinus fermentans A11]OAM92621.1 Ribosomal RNA small subunit methyltransferase A [Pelosinus fermentans DSM 17108]SDQ51204.1 16S rRNA (adenine1518-N6/adenine1519-N6)-dimethyltransferase [Pelosinus fermentans]
MKQPTIANKDVTLHILKRFGIRMSKKLGQNFLIDEHVVQSIVKAANITQDDAVLEIGPGIGTLTQGLAEAGAAVTAVEIDRRLIEVLAKTLEGYENIRVVHGDILRIDIGKEVAAPRYKVVANLPYYITTPIIMGLLEAHMPVDILVTMVQKEVAQRMVAVPGTKDYGSLSVAVQYYTKPEIMFIVPPASFIPPPAVDSAVIRCTVREKPPVEVNERIFFRVVKAAFAQRRKTLSNTLKTTGVPAETLKVILEKAGIDGGRRGETLSLEEFAAIANVWIQ